MIYQVVNNKGKINVTISISEKINLNAQSVKVREGGTLVLVKGTISLETVTTLSCGTSNNSLSELQKKNKKLDKPRIIADFSQLFILKRQNIWKDIVYSKHKIRFF